MLICMDGFTWTTLPGQDNVFSTKASLPYGPLVNTDIDYFRTFLLLFGLFHFRHGMLVMLYSVLGEEKPVLAL